MALPEEAPISWSTFLDDSELIQHLAKKGFGEYLSRHPNRIHSIARGPYVTVIPDIHEAAVTYSTEDQRPIDLYRGRTELACTSKITVQVKRNTHSLSDHVRGLNALSVDDIVEILREKKLLDKALSRAADNDAELKLAKDHLLDYLDYVDNKIAANCTKIETVPFQLELSSGILGSEEVLNTVGQFLGKVVTIAITKSLNRKAR